MKRSIIIISLIISNVLSYGQKYLLIDKNWENRIDSNNDLAPLYFGVEKTNQQKSSDKIFLETAIKIHKTKKSAFGHYYIKAWNYFNLGVIDSAILCFNRSYLLDSTDLRLVYPFGDILSYINPKPDMNNLNESTYPNYKLIKIFKLKEKSRGWDMMIAFGDGIFITKLKNIHSSIVKYDRFPKASILREPFAIDSSKYVKVKIRVDDDEGYYKCGVQDGRWVRYKSNSHKIDFEYNLVNGIRHGITIVYYDDGSKKEEFFHVNGNLEGEHKFYNQKRQLQRIDYWGNNSMDPKDSKILIDE